MNIVQHPTTEVVVDVVPDREQLLLGDMIIDGNNFVPYHAVARYHNHQNAPIGKRKQFNLIERLVLVRYGCSNTKIASNFGQELGGALDPPFHAACFLNFDLEPVQFRLHDAAADEGLDVALISALGRDAASRSMRL